MKCGDYIHVDVQCGSEAVMNGCGLEICIHVLCLSQPCEYSSCTGTTVSSLPSPHASCSPDRGDKMSSAGSGGGASEVTVSHKRKKRKEHQSSGAVEPKSLLLMIVYMFCMDMQPLSG